MKIINGLFTSEAVSAGHPDKLCDRISDTVLDAFLALDPDARVACETFAINDRILVAGEFKAKPGVARQVEAQAEALVRKALKDVGYGTADHDVDPATCLIELAFNAQASEISQAVDGSANLGAGDQGIMFGYGMSDGSVSIPVRRALLYYALKRLGLDTDPQARRPQDQQIVLINREELLGQTDDGQRSEECQ